MHNHGDAAKAEPKELLGRIKRMLHFNTRIQLVPVGGGKVALSISNAEIRQISNVYSIDSFDLDSAIAEMYARAYSIMEEIQYSNRDKRKALYDERTDVRKRMAGTAGCTSTDGSREDQSGCEPVSTSSGGSESAG